jgi:hypothetical protein
MVEQTAMDVVPATDWDAPIVLVRPIAHEPLLSTAIREINLLIARKADKPAKI